MARVIKVLNSTKRNILSELLCEKLGQDTWSCWVQDIDEDKQFVIFEYYDAEQERYINKRATYDVDSKGEMSIKSISSKEYTRVDEYITLPVVKQLNSEQMVAVEPLYIAPDEIDGHECTVDEEALRGMVDSCNKAIKEGRLKSSYDHTTDTEDFHFLKAFINEVDCYIGGQYVPEGQPIIKVQFTNKDAWEKRKSGELLGISIGARGTYEEI